MSVTTPPTKFWIICREETQLTTRLVEEINSWNLPGVRARLSHEMSLSAAAAIAHASHAIFVTLCEYPCAQIQINPVGNVQTSAVQSPASFLNTLRRRHGKAPNAWWFQLPTLAIRSRGIEHILPEHTLSQALTKIELFVRNHYLQYQSMQNAIALGKYPLVPVKAPVKILEGKTPEKMLQTA